MISDPIIQTAGSSETEVAPAEPSPRPLNARGFNVGRYRVRHLASIDGWGHDEGDSTTRALLEVSRIYERGRYSALRIVIGQHSIWIFF